MTNKSICSHMRFEMPDHQAGVHCTAHWIKIENSENYWTDNYKAGNLYKNTFS